MKTTATLGEWMVLGGVVVGAYALYLTYRAFNNTTVADVVDTAATAVDQRGTGSILGYAQQFVSDAVQLTQDINAGGTSTSRLTTPAKVKISTPTADTFGFW